jgi:cytochrome c oxidase subunit 1
METIATPSVQDHGHAHDHAHDHGHHKQSFITKYIFSTDHKMIARQFLFTALMFLLIGGAFALFLRWQLGFPGQPIPIISDLLPQSWTDNGWISDGAITPSLFTQFISMHGTVMIFYVIIPLAVGFFGNFCIPLMIGTDDMAFPKLNMFSFWLTPPAGIILMASFWVDGGAAMTGWTNYPPLSAVGGTGQTLWVISIFLIGFSSIMGAVNYVTTVLNKRAPGMRMFQMPLTVWALFITAVLITLGTPVLASALALVFMDQVFHASIFIPENLLITTKHFSGGGQPILFQHLFWFYSHPAVYIMILPSMGVASDVLATFSRKPVYGYKAMIFAIMAIAFLGFVVWGHHMFQSGMSPLLGTTFMLSTIVIAVPSAIKTFNWLGIMWKGNLHFTAPMLNAVGFVCTFVIGGLSGIFMAVAPIDVYIHDTYFIVAHIHYVLFGGSLFGIFSGIYYWYPKISGRMYNEAMARRHFWWSFITFNATFFPMHLLGIGGHMRRVFDPYVYDFLKHFEPMNRFITIAAILLGFSQLLLILNVIWSWRYGKKAPRNPWHANSLEWAAPSPPPHGNFDMQLRVYRGPYEYSLPDMEEDYLPQWVERTEGVRSAETHAQHSELASEYSDGRSN